MFTDIVGYTALAHRNEAATLSLLEKHNQLIRSVISRYKGIEVKTMGDSFLIEFGSALEATECAVEIQRVLHVGYNESMRVRIGIHVGDVIHRGRDILGDAVNIASRIEGFAEGGEICISEQVYAQIRNKLQLKITKLEPRELKNISFRIGIYKLETPLGGSKMENAGQTQEQLDMNRIAVLPFSNISPDPKDEYFADGLTEELISKLSLVKGIKVIARTSVIKYKGRDKGASEIGQELRAGVIVEGSVRKAGNKIRVNVQVVDANTEEHLWSTTYDNNLDDIFAVQEEIAMKVSRSLPIQLPPPIPAEQATGGTKNITAYTLYLKGMQLLNEGTGDSLREALDLFTKATRLDPTFARACTGLGNCYGELGHRSYISYDEMIKEMKSAASKALGIEPNLAEGHSLLAWIAWTEDHFVTAEAEGRKAIELNPSCAEAYQLLGSLKLAGGYPKTAIKLLETAHLLDPLSSDIMRQLGVMLVYSGREADAMSLWDRNMNTSPFDAHFGLFTYYSERGELEKAEEEVRKLEELSPEDFNTISFRGLLSARKGEVQGTQDAIQKLQRMFKGGPTVEPVIGVMKYYLGDLDGFFDSAFKSADAHMLNPMLVRYAVPSS